MDAINTVSLTRPRVETVSETEARETIDAVCIGATVDTVLAEEEMGATANVVLTGAEMGIEETIDVFLIDVILTVAEMGVTPET